MAEIPEVQRPDPCEELLEYLLTPGKFEIRDVLQDNRHRRDSQSSNDIRVSENEFVTRIVGISAPLMREPLTWRSGRDAVESIGQVVVECPDQNRVVDVEHFSFRA